VLGRQYELVAKNHAVELTGVVVDDGRAHIHTADPHDPVLKPLQDAADAILLICDSDIICGKNEK
jgi:hypothetical protein